MPGDPVSKFIPEFKNPKVLKKTADGDSYSVPAENEITIFHLLTHTSGITYQWNEERGQLYLENEIAPMVRKICKITGFKLKYIYELFPSGPAKGAAKIAGLPKPDGCV